MDDDEIVREFLVESHENLDQLDQDLVSLEADATDPEILSRIFRTIHTIKGTCGFLGFSKLEWVTHVGENLLSRLREGELDLTHEITTALLSLVDAVREILGCIESNGGEGDTNYDRLVAELTRLHDSPGQDSTELPTQSSEVSGTSNSAEVEMEASSESVESETDASRDAPPVPADSTEVTGRLNQRIEQYLLETYEHTEQLDQDLVMLEAQPTDPELLTRIVGTMHTIKSASGLLAYRGIEEAAHAGEDLLAELRTGTQQFSPEVTSALLSLVDSLRQALIVIETTGDDGKVDCADVIRNIRELKNDPVDQAAEIHDLEPERQAAKPEGQAAKPASDPLPQPEMPQAIQDAPKAPAATQTVHAEKASSSTSQARTPSVADTSIRVDVGLLDMLMDQVGELVLARNRIMQFSTHQEDRSVVAAYQRLDMITSELQERVMKTRMQPIGTIWNKFPRVVRDLARECDKKVSLIMEGQETELDRTLIEAIRDPLTHLVRNAVDHGIESPQQRREAGKDETGTLLLRAFHEGGQVNIGISDDGGGIDPERIARLAVKRKLITSAQAELMSDREVFDLIFAPGFSTAEKVTNVSGRGVGMDVVKNNIEKINGTIDIQSDLGSGSTIKIKIPLTLAIIPALVIRCAGDRYAIPQTSLIELVRLEGNNAKEKIETIRGAPVYRLRGKLLPLVYLDTELGFESAKTDDGLGNGVIHIVVLQADERQFGLVVESVLDTEEIVVKPLGRQVKDIPVFAGATIMGDGRVALILDVLGLAERASVISDQRVAQASESIDDRPRAQLQTLLLVEIADQRMAFPLSRVTRLEEFPLTDVERSGRVEVVQYWGQVMPLIRLSQFMLDQSAADTETNAIAQDDQMIEVVVLNMHSRSVGVVVDRIVDTVEGAFDVQPLRSRKGVMGTVVVQGQVTELLDLDELSLSAAPAFFDQIESLSVEGP